MWGYLNSKGEVRRDAVRFPREERPLELDADQDQVTLVRLYREWVRDDDYVLLDDIRGQVTAVRPLLF